MMTVIKSSSNIDENSKGYVLLNGKKPRIVSNFKIYITLFLSFDLISYIRAFNYFPVNNAIPFLVGYNKIVVYPARIIGGL